MNAMAWWVLPNPCRRTTSPQLLPGKKSQPVHTDPLVVPQLRAEPVGGLVGGRGLLIEQTAEPLTPRLRDHLERTLRLGLKTQQLTDRHADAILTLVRVLFGLCGGLGKL